MSENPRAGGSPDAASPQLGWVSPQLHEEFPALALHHTTVERGSGRSTSEVKARLRTLSDRFSGAQAINLRHQPIPWAYRVFYRHIGLDPDEQRTPVEELALERMRHGGFRSRNLLDDALTIATIESGVALRAFDADRVSGRPGSAPSEAGEALEGRPGELPAGTLVIADEHRPVSLLFGALAAGRGSRRDLAHAARRDPGRRRARDRGRGGALAGRRRAHRLTGAHPRPGPSASALESGRPPIRMARVQEPRAQQRVEESRVSTAAPGADLLGAPGPATTERLARNDLRRQIASSSAVSASCSHRPSHARASSGGSAPSAAHGCSGSASSSGCATRSPCACAMPRPSSHARADAEEANRGLLERDDRRARAASLGDRLQRGHRRTRLSPLAFAPALGHPRDAVRLVASPALVRLSVSHGASAPGHRGPLTS